jgi:hypothetical protein
MAIKNLNSTPNDLLTAALEKQQQEIKQKPAPSASVGFNQSDNSVVTKTREPETAAVQDLPPSYQDTMTPRHHDTVIPRNQGDLTDLVRKAVKQFGKEAATHRFTLAEKNAIAEVVFAYRGKGIKTSENEMTRIAINYLIFDYQLNREKSILNQILEKLNF